MKKKRNLYIIAFLCFITLVGVTIAYLQSQDVFENIFNAGTYSVITHEEFVSPTNWKPGDTTPKTIVTTNEGTIPVRVRVKLEESWTDSNGDPLDLTFTNNSNTENVAIINLDNINDWIYKDGYYYYKDEIASGEETTSLISGVTFNPNYEGDINCIYNSTTNSYECSSSGYMGGEYKLKITTETVQSDVYREVWGSSSPILHNYVGSNPCTYNGELVQGAEYINGQYTYVYKKEWNFDSSTENIIWLDIQDYGWGVRLTDLDSTDPITTTLCSSINNKPIVSMSYMFRKSQAISIDLSSFDTSNVTNMRFMFYRSQATSLNLSSFLTSNVIDMHAMFRESQATTLDLSSFNTSNVTDMSLMFYNSQATSIDVSSFDTSNVTDMGYIFMNTKATTLDFTNFDTSNVTDMSHMFENSKAVSLDLSNIDTSNVTDMKYMFSNSQVTTLDLSGFDTSNVIYMQRMFYKSQVTTLDLSSFDTSNVTNMRSMFENSLAATLNLSNFDTSNVEDMSNMFKSSQATTFDLSSFDTSKVTNMNSMFYESQATTLDLSSFDTSNVTDMRYIFQDALATTGYGRTQTDCDRLNASSNKPSGLIFVVKGN